MKQNKPIKRHPSLQNLSREHHDILIFGLRLKKGIQKNASLEVINNYVIWFWNNYLKAHFKMEETELFPLIQELSSTSKALQQHKYLKFLLMKQNRNYEDLIELYSHIEKNVRFEERILFNEVQEFLSKNQLSSFQEKHPNQLTCALWSDPFWK
ncbi:MAG: hemerythrin domain-containing protein [Flavobacteriaceae bacterium]|nr:hemerythrin domain-containing protein [Flavobacteriaceae bacterium]